MVKVGEIGRMPRRATKGNVALCRLAAEANNELAANIQLTIEKARGNGEAVSARASSSEISSLSNKKVSENIGRIVKKRRWRAARIGALVGGATGLTIMLSQMLAQRTPEAGETALSTAFTAAAGSLVAAEGQRLSKGGVIPREIAAKLEALSYKHVRVEPEELSDALNAWAQTCKTVAGHYRDLADAYNSKDKQKISSVRQEIKKSVADIKREVEKDKAAGRRLQALLRA